MNSRSTSVLVRPVWTAYAVSRLASSSGRRMVTTRMLVMLLYMACCESQHNRGSKKIIVRVGMVDVRNRIEFGSAP